MRGIFAKPTPTASTPEQDPQLGRFTNSTQEDELQEFTVASSMNMFDYFASISSTSHLPLIPMPSHY